MLAGQGEASTGVRRWPSGLEASWALLALCVPFVFAASSPIQGDTWWTLKTGELIVQGQHLLTRDPFSFGTPSYRFVDAQWLSQVVYYVVYQLLGLEGVALFTAILNTAIFGIVLHLSAQRSKNLRVAAVATLLAAAGTISYFLAWAQTLGFLYFQLTYWLLGSKLSTRWKLMLLSGVEVIWVNSHGSFVLGPALTLLLLLGEALAARREQRDQSGQSAERIRFLGIAGAFQVLATIANPYGLAVYQYVAALGTDPVIRAFISAWQPTSVANPTGLVFFASVVVVIGVIACSARKPTAVDLLLLACFAGLGLQAIRHVPWWILAATPIVAEKLAAVPFPSLGRNSREAGSTRPKPRWPAPALALLGTIIVLVAVSLPWTKSLNPLLPREKRGIVDPAEPQAAAEYLSARSLPPHALAYQPWGGYLEWRLWPRYLVLVDGRIEVHAPSVWLDYQRISEGRADWRESLAREGVDLMVLHNLDQAYLISLARASQEWHQVYQDQQATIFERVAVVPGAQ